MKFLSTGVYETIEREELIDLIKGSGGHYYSGMSKNLHYLLVGRDAGPVKLRTAEECGITQLSEEEFFAFITDKIENYDPVVAAETAAKLKEEEQERKKAKKSAETVQATSTSDVQSNSEKKAKIEQKPKIKAEPVVEVNPENEAAPTVKPKAKKSTVKVEKTAVKVEEADEQPVKTKRGRLAVKKESAVEPKTKKIKTEEMTNGTAMTNGASASKKKGVKKEPKNLSKHSMKKAIERPQRSSGRITRSTAH